MYWTLELASSLDDAPWPATKEELIDYANRSGAPEEVIENLEELEEELLEVDSSESVNEEGGVDSAGVPVLDVSVGPQDPKTKTAEATNNNDFFFMVFYLSLS